MIDIREKASFVNSILKKYLPEDTKEFGDITEAMNYSVLAGGKRLRAIMLLESFRLFNTESDMERLLAHPFAAAIEFIHAYSLVHDDLPAMDNDMYRRGLPTTHSKYGHAMGILAGDALLNYAFETMTGALTSISSLRGEFVTELYTRASKAMQIVASKAGYSGMIGGQVLDVNSPESDINSIDKSVYKIKLLKIYELKTSDLFRASLGAGATLGGASDDDLKKLDSFGYNLGLAFQIRDDILDETSTLDKLGKDTGSDVKNNKITICNMMGIENAQNMVNEKIANASAILETLPGNTDFFRQLLEYLKEREN